jgi:hypothetical protein
MQYASGRYDDFARVPLRISSEQRSKVACPVALPLEIQLPGTEFLEAETGESALEAADVHRDGKSGDDTGEIPTETASLESPTKPGLGTLDGWDARDRTCDLLNVNR